MGKNKKKFIDKKNASTYHLMHRSQRDVAGDAVEEEDGGEGLGGMILWPEPQNKPETNQKVLGTDNPTMNEWRNKLKEAGLLDNVYNEDYLRPITGTGTFLDADNGGKVGTAMFDPRSRAVEEEALMEVTTKFDSINLTADCMDDDIEEALFGNFEGDEFEELNDDFVFDVAKEPEAEENAFDFDAHIAKLMQKAKLETAEANRAVHADEAKQHAWGKQDEDFFAHARPLHAIGEDHDNDESVLVGGMSVISVGVSGVVPALGPEEEAALCQKIEETMAEYDSDEIGDIWEEDIRGTRELEGDKLVEDAIDDFLQEKKDEIFIDGSHRKANSKGGSGFTALVGKRMVSAKELDNNGQPIDSYNRSEIRPIEDILKDAKQTLMRPKLEPPPEEIQIDGKSYFSHKERNPWDCESILSTYSNLDNNPVAIGGNTRRRKNKKKSSVAPTEEFKQIRLSSKTGLPIREDEVCGEDDFGNDTYVSVNRGEARKKGESAEEKKARKIAIKKERQMARMQKKAMKQVFKDEYLKRSAEGVVDDVGGKTVFRYA